MTLALRTIISVLISLMIMLIVYITMPNYFIEPRGMVLPINGFKKPYMGMVQAYSTFNSPFFPQKIGSITVEYHTHTNSLMDEEKVINYAKSLSAASGGNGIVFSLGQSVPSTRSAMAMMVLQGDVINTK